MSSEKIGSVSPIGRREALKRVGALAAAPVLAGYHPLVPVPQDGAPWKPRFLDAREAELVAELAERIIPETETPGAKAANVHQYIDLVLSEAVSESQQSFRSGLRRFADTNEARQLEILSEGGAFFDQLKELTVDGYYKSEIGMKEELDFEGRTFVTVFEGCTHEEHLEWTPLAADTSRGESRGR
jgi:hypothetical protein